jgi:hypothetical protein
VYNISGASVFSRLLLFLLLFYPLSCSVLTAAAFTSFHHVATFSSTPSFDRQWYGDSGLLNTNVSSTEAAAAGKKKKQMKRCCCILTPSVNKIMNLLITKLLQLLADALKKKKEKVVGGSCLKILMHFINLYGL